MSSALPSTTTTEVAETPVLARASSATRTGTAGSRPGGGNDYFKRYVLQIRLLMWKRYRESIKSKLEIAKVFLPIILFFILLVLLYKAFSFFPEGLLESFFVPFAFWLFVQRMVVQIMYEKSNRLQESMKMMGLKSSAYWLSYLLADGVVLGLLLAFIAAIISAPAKLFNGADFGTILGFFFVYCLSAVPFAFFLTSFFDSPQTAGQATLAVLMGLYVVVIVIFTAGKATISIKEAQIICSFVPPMALQLGSGSFVDYYDGISISKISGILVADIFIYAGLAWYFSEIWPSELGVPKPFYFPFLPSYWFPRAFAKNDSTDCLTGTNAAKVSSKDGQGENNPAPDLVEEGRPKTIPIEAANESLLGSPVVAVKNLVKSFGKYKAVNDLSFSMYENQIFALLGHNGAGKSTTINVLTGLTPPDYYSGSKNSNAFIYGSSIMTDMDSVRLSMGVCPQHDVLFETLTVREHILLFSQLKGYSYAQANAEAEELTKLFHLEKRLDHFGNELSGGQKRKLSVAIAICGGSKFIVLDEPTAGMDPLARRELWDLLAALRRGRAILLTTHYMDEADILGDRVGIMSLGQMQCMGTPQFLKGTYGAGYRLIFDVDDSFHEDGGVELQKLTKFVQDRVPTATVVADISDDGKSKVAKESITFNLPFDAIGQFGQLFTALETYHGKAKEYNLAMTTLEDVFLKVGEDHTVTPHGDGRNVVGIGSDRAYQTSFFSQVIGLMQRKLINAKNDFTTIPLLALPIVAAIASAIIYKMNLISKNLETSDLAITGILIGGYLGAAGFIAEFLVRERSDKLRNVLTVMGCDFKAYWLGTFLADLILMMIPCVILWICWGAAGMPHFYASENGLCFFLTFLFTVQLIGFGYFFSYIFTSPKSCISFMPMLVLFLLILPNILIMIAVQIAQAVGRQISSQVLVGALMWGTMILSPHGALFCAFLNVVNDYSDIAKVNPPIGACIAFMLVESVGFILYAYYIDSLTVVSVTPSTDSSFDPIVLNDLDDDVQKERDRILGAVAQAVGSDTQKLPSGDIEMISDKSADQSDPLVVKKLRKVFPPKAVGRESVVACEDLAFGVRKGEIFGLLGANGAGKTTALSLLTRLMLPTSGDATIVDRSVLTHFSKAANHLGVVTQNNSLWDRLSVEDHLYLFARIRGVPEDLVKQIVEGTIDQLELTPHRHKLSMSLSGGMKRKLCVAIALIGDPEVVLLDEPSAGLDPVSRRNLWTVILRTMSTRSVILTTHSMEEAEVLCHRIAIMVRGQLRALGTKQRLKNKFGAGFELSIKVLINDFDRQRAELHEFVLSMFPSAVILNENGGLFTFQIPKEEMNIGKVFTMMEEKKSELRVEDYSVAQPTLEQVFIRTVNKHTPQTGSINIASLNVVPAEAVVQDVNKCGCTDFFVKILCGVTFALFILFWIIAIFVFGRSNPSGASIFFVLGFASIITTFVGLCLLCCACCRPPKGNDE